MKLKIREFIELTGFSADETISLIDEQQISLNETSDGPRICFNTEDFDLMVKHVCRNHIAKYFLSLENPEEQITHFIEDVLKDAIKVAQSNIDAKLQ